MATVGVKGLTDSLVPMYTAHHRTAAAVGRLDSRTIPRLTLLISRRRCGLAYYTLHSVKQGLAIADVMKSAEFWSECGRAKCFFSHVIMFYTIVFDF